MRSTDPARRRTLAVLAAVGLAAASAVPRSGTATEVPTSRRAAQGSAGRPHRIEPLTLEGWPALRASLPRPSVLFFTSTWCATCPEAFDAIRDSMRERGLDAPVIAVVVDGDALGRGLRDPRVAHLAHARRVLAFHGHEARLRHAVDPSWRGVVPYVGLVAADGSLGYAAGPPSTARLDAWAARR
jgi:hypothetical protein